MTARAPRRRQVDAVLTVVAGYYEPPAVEGEEPRFVYAPRAAYRCARRPYRAQVRGRQTAAFAATIRTDHRAQCPGWPTRKDTAR